MGRPKTKIIATIGPATVSKEQIRSMIEAGANVLRLNFSHGTHSTHGEVLARIKEVRKELQLPVSILLDTKGFEIRVSIRGESPLTIQEKDRLWMGEGAPLDLIPSYLLNSIDKGSSILFDDGYLLGEVMAKEEGRICIEFKNSHILRHRKSVHLPHIRWGSVELSEKDREDILFGCREGIDWIALSFVNSKEYVLNVRKMLYSEGFFDIPLISKIETSTAVGCLEEILQVSDGVMVARGDLGVELPLEEVPPLQKRILRKAAEMGKLSIVATQMLESMIERPRPTRAEVSDVANAIFDAASAVMLSGETAVGAYAIQSIEQMKKIILEAEKSFDYNSFYYEFVKERQGDVNNAVAKAAVQLSISSNTKGILVFSTSGRSASMMSCLRPSNPILCVTNQEKTYQRLSLQWGVVPLLFDFSSLEDALNRAASFAIREKMLRFGDLVVMTFGSPLKKVGTTNTIRLQHLGSLLLQGKSQFSHQVTGVLKRMDATSSEHFCLEKGRILLFYHFFPEMELAMEYASGAILVAGRPFEESKQFLVAAQNVGIPAIYEAEGIVDSLQDGLYVTMDGSTGSLISAHVEDRSLS